MCSIQIYSTIEDEREFDDKIMQMTQELKVKEIALANNKSQVSAVWDPMFSNYTDSMDKFYEYHLINLDNHIRTNEDLVNLDNHKVTNEDLVRRAVRHILSTEITEKVLLNEEFSYYKENFTTGVSLMHRFNSLLRDSRKNIKTRWNHFRKTRAIEFGAEFLDSIGLRK